MDEHLGRQEDPNSSRSRNLGSEVSPSTGPIGHLTPKDGYPGFAEFIAADTDNTGFVFRSFRVLVARNLLHMQSELIHLSLELERYEANTDSEVRRSWSHFMGDEKRRKLATDLSVKLRAYRTSLMLLTRLITTNR
jgi:hypothetical protein